MADEPDTDEPTAQHLGGGVIRIDSRHLFPIRGYCLVTIDEAVTLRHELKNAVSEYDKEQ